MGFNGWLESEGLGKHADALAANDIDEVEILADLNDAELESLGIPIGARKKIRRALARLGYEVGNTQALSPQLAVPEATPSPPETLSAEPQSAWSEAPAQEPASEPAAQPASVAPVEPAPITPSHLAPVTSSPQAFDAQATRHEPKAKNSRKATAIMVAVGVHVALIIIATTLTIFAASKDEPEIIAAIAPPSTSPQQEMKKKTVQKQVKRAPSAASAAAAPMAQMMKANAAARFTTPEVTRTSTGPLGVGEGDLGTGAFGVGDGLGDAGDGGGMFMGTSTSANLAVVFDITASVGEALPVVVKEIQRTFKDAQVVSVFGASFKRRNQNRTLIPYKDNKPVLALVRKYSKAKADEFNKVLFSLSRSESIEEKSRDPEFRQSLGTAIEILLNQENPPGNIFVFSDFADGVDPRYMQEMQALARRKRCKVVFWFPFSPDDKKPGWLKARKYYLEFAEETGGEVKQEKLK